MKLGATDPEIIDAPVDLPGRLPACPPRWRLTHNPHREGPEKNGSDHRLRGGFRFHLVAVYANAVVAFRLLTAYFDDHDEPLVTRTSLLDEEIIQDIVLLLPSDSFYVRFFDERSICRRSSEASSSPATLTHLPNRYRGAVDRCRLGGMLRIKHAPHLAFANTKIAGETALRNTGLTERFVEERL